MDGGQDGCSRDDDDYVRAITDIGDNLWNNEDAEASIICEFDREQPLTIHRKDL